MTDAGLDVGVATRRRFPMRALAISAAMTGALVLCGGWAIWRLYVGFSGIATTELRIRALAGEILRLDEVLTMSARMAAATGDPKWETRYLANEPVLDAIIKETMALAPEAYIGTSAAETDDANIKLVAMEHRAFDLVREGKAREASDVLFSTEYERQKAIYSRGMMDGNRAILHRATSSLAAQRFHILIACGLCAAILVVLAVSWRRILRLIVTYLRTTEAAERALAGVNRDLEKRTADLRERTSELETTITELHATQDKLMLADRLVSIGRLSAGIAHEINNPLAYVIGNLQFLEEETRDAGEDVRESLADAAHGAQRMSKIVESLKLFARADHDERSSVDVSQVAASALKIAANEIRHRARLTTEWGPTPHVEGDPGRLGQVFLNLIVNASQALTQPRDGGHEICVRTFTDAAGRAVVEVADSGEGIPEDLLDRVFDPFFTTKPVGVGTGLGLSICHGIVTAHGGEIAVASERGRGSTFTVTLPAGPGAEVEAAPSGAATASAAA